MTPLHPDRRERGPLLVLLGVIGGLGCIALVAGALIAPIFVPGHDSIADTISDLAAGENEFIMDFALYGFAASLLALALAASHAHLGRWGWTVGVLSLAVLAVLVTVIGARNEYGDGDNEGVVIHIYLVYGLGAFFLLAPVALAPALMREHRAMGRAVLGLGLLWGVSAPWFFLLPTSVDGLYERLLGLVAAAMVACLSAIFVRRGTGNAGRTTA